MTAPPPVVVVSRDADVLAAAVAARLVTRLVDAQAVRGTASLVLTGGSIGIAALRAVRDSPARLAVDWRRVDLWWGDERFVPADDPDRNERQAREAWMVVGGADKAPAVTLALGGAGRVQVPAAGGVGRTQTLWLLDEAAAAELPRALRRL